MSPIDPLTALPGDLLVPDLLLAQAHVLVSLYKPILMLATLAVWGWVVTSIYDKDAARWYFQRQTWNLVHMAFGFAAVALVLALNFGRISFWITWPSMIVLLTVDLLIYFFLRNADDRVPESQHWSLNPAVWVRTAQANRPKKAAARKTEYIIRGARTELAVPQKETPEYEVRIGVERLFERLIDMRASQLDVAPVGKDSYAVVVMVDGVRERLEQVPANAAAAMMDMIKAGAGMDVSDRRRRQRGEIHVGKEGANLLKVGVTTIGTSAGMRLTLQPDPAGQVNRSVDELGLLPNQLDDLRSIVKDKGGVVLQVAPPDHGRTTTFYTLIRQHDAYTSNVQTIELEPELLIDGVRHNEFDPGGGAEFSTTVRSVLRRDPDVLAIAELPDAETAREIATADHSRTRVYVSFREQGALEAIRRYVQAVGNARQASDGLKGVVAQKLVRRLCTNCRVPFQPTADVLRKLGLPGETKQLYRKSGKVLVKDKEAVCPVCNGTGYFGQLGIFAVHTIGPEERELVAGGDLKQLRGIFRQKKQQSVQTAGLQHVLAGDTSVDELLRVTAASGQNSKEARSSQQAPAGEPASAEA